MKRKEKDMEEKEKNGYEKVREERIRENKERMQKLGLLQLSRTLTSSSSKPKRPSKILPPLHPLRRSSRLENMDAVSYKDTPVKRDTRRPKGKTLDLPTGGSTDVQECQEFYTAGHVKLLGSYVKPWILYENGRGTYDALKGNTCHQCRQKTLGCHTCCSKCRVFDGQLCGDCLYMRYGENVLEVMENPNWICPVCRGICNCSVCRSKKGWPPTGSLYRKVLKMGFESVAHYLVLTRQAKVSTSGSIANAKKKSRVVKDSVPN